MTSENSLDTQRALASFDLEALVAVLEPCPELRFLKKHIWQTIERDPYFHKQNVTPGVEEQKRQTTIMMKRLHELLPQFLPPHILQGNYKKKTLHLLEFNIAIALVNRNLSVKYGLGVSLFSNALQGMGTSRHLKYAEAAWRGELLNCFAITEFAHGSNTKELRTTATYDPKTEEFVIHTPDFEAAKCWSGNLGRTCTYSIVLAQLLLANGERHGLHAFLVPIRDPNTLLPFPGVTVGDMGEKIGLNGIDNGFVIFSNYRIPRANLLNKTGDVDDEGNYHSCFTNPQQILGAALESLSAGRLAITSESTYTLSCVVSIAVRYGAVRKQFGPTPGAEQVLIDYPTHQLRLFPYLAATCAFKLFMFVFWNQYLDTVETSYSNKHARLNELSETVSEIHAIVCCAKALTSWTCRDGIQVAREACGGHGYLKAAGLGDLRNDHDPSVTYEGDNTVLIQQTSNWLLRQWATGATDSPLHTVDFLLRRAELAASTCTASSISQVTNLQFLRNAYEWLLCWLLGETEAKLMRLQMEGADRFTARAHTQVYRAGPLSLIFAEYNVLMYCMRRLENSSIEEPVQGLVERLTVLYGLWCIDKHLPFFYEGEYAKGPEMTRLVRDGLIAMCSGMRREAVLIVDALAPPDFVLNSVLGCADGRIYHHLKKAVFTSEATQRASWWRDVVSKL